MENQGSEENPEKEPEGKNILEINNEEGISNNDNKEEEKENEKVEEPDLITNNNNQEPPEPGENNDIPNKEDNNDNMENNININEESTKEEGVKSTDPNTNIDTNPIEPNQNEEVTKKDEAKDDDTNNKNEEIEEKKNDKDSAQETNNEKIENKEKGSEAENELYGNKKEPINSNVKLNKRLSTYDNIPKENILTKTNDFLRKFRSYTLNMGGNNREEKDEKKGFFQQLSDDEKYKKLIQLKEETENELKKTVSNKSSSNFIKSLVSRNKARFNFDDFDLDLTYITMKIIAMGLPSTSLEGIYRNKMDDVKRFFNTRHPKHHKIYNLCVERNYPKDSFYQQGYYPFPDHEAPPINSLIPFCEDAKKFLDEDEKNVVAVHCKAGKGRTGTFICCLLLYLGILDTADECMKYYGLMRVGAEKGVTIPSQKRYVHYFEHMVHNNISTPFKPKPICIKSMKMYTVPHSSTLGNSCAPTFTIESKTKKYNHSDFKKKTTYDCSLPFIEFPLNLSGFNVDGDVLVTFYHIHLFRKDKIFKFWFNTYFLPESGIFQIEKEDLDKAFKDKGNKIFSPNFKIELKYVFI